MADIDELEVEINKTENLFRNLYNSEGRFLVPYDERTEKIHKRIIVLSLFLLFFLFIDLQIGSIDQRGNSGTIFGISIRGIETEEILLGSLLYMKFHIIWLTWNNYKHASSSREEVNLSYPEFMSFYYTFKNYERRLNNIKTQLGEDLATTARHDLRLTSFNGVIKHQLYIWHANYLRFIEFKIKNLGSFFLPMLIFNATHQQLFRFYKIAPWQQIIITIIILTLFFALYWTFRMFTKMSHPSRDFKEIRKYDLLVKWSTDVIIWFFLLYSFLKVATND